MPQSDERQHNLARMQATLSTPDGEILMEELRLAWDLPKLLGATEQETAYNCGARDCYKFLDMLRNGELIDE